MLETLGKSKTDKDGAVKLAKTVITDIVERKL